MRRRFNYTGRQRIKKQDLAFSIVEDDHNVPAFYADIDLRNYNLPLDAGIWVEAYDPNALMRFPFGTVGNPGGETPCRLTDFVGTDSYYFRVKVVDKHKRFRLLAVADEVRPLGQHEEESATSLLRVAVRDLESVPWSLEYQDTNHPLLVINSRIDAGKSLATNNAFFQAVVFPAILEQILRRILLEQSYQPGAEVDDDDMWKEAWLEFAGSLPGNAPLRIDQGISTDDLERWITETRNSFCEDINAITKISTSMKGAD